MTESSIRMPSLAPVALAGLVLICAGCIGTGDISAPDRKIAGDYYLWRSDSAALFLVVGDDTTSVAGPITESAWTPKYILAIQRESSGEMISEVFDTLARRELKGDEKAVIERQLRADATLFAAEDAWRKLGKS